jgi:hypothetical protein
MFIYILIREDDDDVYIVDTYQTVHTAWAGWKHHVIGGDNDLRPIDRVSATTDAVKLLEYEDLRTYRRNGQYSYRMKCVPVQS